VSPVCKHAQRLHMRERFVPGYAVRQHTGKLRHLSDPAPVSFALEFHLEGHTASFEGSVERYRGG
jgi:hypothetical protein